MYKYLVLGSSGFIGQKLCAYLKSKNCDVLEFDLKNHFEEDLRIIENQKLQESIAKCDFIFFLAFDIGGSKFLNKCSHNKEFLINNTKIISNTFEALSNYNKKFIFISSYLTRNTEHSYGLLKLLGEQFATALNGLAIRLFNVYGSENLSIRSHVIPDIIYQALRNKIIVLNSTGEEKRQFLYIDDCCEGLYVASQYFEELLNKSNIIDLTSYEWISIKHVAQIVSKKLNCDLKLNNESAFNNCDYSPNKYILNYWKPKTSLDKGISITIDEMNYV